MGEGGRFALVCTPVVLRHQMVAYYRVHGVLAISEGDSSLAGFQVTFL